MNTPTKLITTLGLSMLLMILTPINTYASETSSDTEVTYTDSDLRLMSSIIFCEAGNQCSAGQQAVGIVIMNRVWSEDFPDTIEEVIYQENQFVPASTGFLSNALKMYDTNEIPEACIDAAEYALSEGTYVNYEGEIIDMIDCLFFSRHVENCYVTIGDHDFK